jgi:hypothetical protein
VVCLEVVEVSIIDKNIDKNKKLVFWSSCGYEVNLVAPGGKY